MIDWINNLLKSRNGKVIVNVPNDKKYSPYFKKGSEYASGYDVKAISISSVHRSDNEKLDYEVVNKLNNDFQDGMPFWVKPNSRVLIGTGVRLQLPNNIEAEIRSRSSVPTNTGVIVGNGVGTVDNDYTGELKVSLINTSAKDVRLIKGQKIAQVLLKETIKVDIEYGEIKKKTSRGSGGFGSTGV
jgi:dUTP pyrophosphatase